MAVAFLFCKSADKISVFIPAALAVAVARLLRKIADKLSGNFGVAAISVNMGLSCNFRQSADKLSALVIAAFVVAVEHVVCPAAA